jgi:hypothetical protein
MKYGIGFKKNLSWRMFAGGEPGGLARLDCEQEDPDPTPGPLPLVRENHARSSRTSRYHFLHSGSGWRLYQSGKERI